MRSRIVIIGFLSVMMIACGGGESSSTADDDDDGGGIAAKGSTQASFEKNDFWRFDLLKGENGLELFDQSVVLQAVPPLPSMDADYLAIAYAGDVVVEVFPFRFAEVAFIDGVDSQGEPLAEEIEIEGGAVPIFIRRRPDVERVVIKRTDGTAELTIEVDAINEIDDVRASGTLSREWTKSGTMAIDDDAFRVLQPGDEAMVPQNLTAFSEVVDPTDHLEKLRAAFNKLPAASQAATRTIGIVKMKAKDILVMGEASGQTVLLNEFLFTFTTAEPVDREFFLIHEAAHCFTDLLDSRSTSVDFEQWPSETHKLAEKCLDEFRLYHGLSDNWYRIHFRAVSHGLASGYRGDEAQKMAPEDAYLGGFASPYGGINELEDIATYVAVAATNGDHLRNNEGICGYIRKYGQIEKEIALPVAKLILLEGLGLISKEQKDACTGDLQISEEQGVNLGPSHHDGNVVDGVSFTEIEGVGYYTQEGRTMLGFVADGPNTYRIALQLDTPDYCALGTHLLEKTTFFSNMKQNNRILVDHEDLKYSRASEGGVVVILESSRERVWGCIFGLGLLNGWAMETDYIPFSTFNLPY